mmetsp:Transcript_136357/g.236567  ORF Transcript_136357/g.236567 Transcript_136357/m.236567 type:complete len:118 (-) Transcript_136357:29-382(-)
MQGSMSWMQCMDVSDSPLCAACFVLALHGPNGAQDHVKSGSACINLLMDAPDTPTRLGLPLMACRCVIKGGRGDRWGKREYLNDSNELIDMRIHLFADQAPPQTPGSHALASSTERK